MGTNQYNRETDRAQDDFIVNVQVRNIIHGTFYS